MADSAAGLVDQNGIGHGEADLEEDALFVLRDQTSPAPIPNQSRHSHDPDDQRADHREDDVDHPSIDTRRVAVYPCDVRGPEAPV